MEGHGSQWLNVISLMLLVHFGKDMNNGEKFIRCIILHKKLGFDQESISYV